MKTKQPLGKTLQHQFAYPLNRLHRLGHRLQQVGLAEQADVVAAAVLTLEGALVSIADDYEKPRKQKQQRQPKAELAIGARIQLKAKVAADYADFMDASDMNSIRVTALSGKFVHAVTGSGVKLSFRKGHVQAIAEEV